MAARAASLIDLTGGWDSFVQRARKEFEMNKLNNNGKVSSISGVILLILLCLILATFLLPIDGFSIAILFSLCLTCAWNVHAYFSNKSMWPTRFVELDSSGSRTYRKIAFWSTLALYFCVLFGVAFQSIQ